MCTCIFTLNIRDNANTPRELVSDGTLAPDKYTTLAHHLSLKPSKANPIKRSVHLKASKHCHGTLKFTATTFVITLLLTTLTNCSPMFTEATDQ